MAFLFTGKGVKLTRLGRSCHAGPAYESPVLRCAWQTCGPLTPYRYGDEEAVEDFLAIGKDPNEGDAQGRTALHYATAYDQPVIARMLLGTWMDFCMLLGVWVSWRVPLDVDVNGGHDAGLNVEASYWASCYLSVCCWVHIYCWREVGV